MLGTRGKPHTEHTGRVENGSCVLFSLGIIRNQEIGMRIEPHHVFPFPMSRRRETGRPPFELNMQVDVLQRRAVRFYSRALQ